VCVCVCVCVCADSGVTTADTLQLQKLLWGGVCVCVQIRAVYFYALCCANLFMLLPRATTMC